MAGSRMDGGSSDTGREPEGTGLGMGSPGEQRGEADVQRSVEKSIHPIVVQDGIEFYAITRYHGSNKWIDYQPVEGWAVGSGTYHPISPATHAKAALSRKHAAERKAARAMAYEERVYAALESVASLQENIINLANDPDSQPAREEMEKLRLGLAAGESILNRALGKAVTKIDGDVRHSVSDEIATIEAEWAEVEDM